jgi:acyl dehydratase
MSESLKNVQVGQELAPLELPAVSRTTLALFAGASGDHNPIHINLDFARNAGMPDVFAQGMLGMAWLGRLLTGWVPQDRLRRFDVRFHGITHLGNSISCRGRVTELIDRPGGDGVERCARVEISAINQFNQTKIVGEALIALD